MDKWGDMNGDAVLQGLHAIVISQLPESMEKAQAQAIADAVVAEVAHQFGGQQIYFQLRSPYIARMIVAQFTGDNVKELVARFHISRSAIYKILQRENNAKKGGLEQYRLPGC